MQFSDCIGQEMIQERLTQFVQSQRVHHAHLFLAKPGGGGLPLALAFAQYLNCLSPLNDDSCGQCSSCLKMQKLIHPDVNFTFPSVKAKGGKRPPISLDYLKNFREFVLHHPYGEERDWLATIESGNRQGNITALECLEIIKTVKLKRVEGKYRINIIWKAERLAKEGNRLLKVIEEPPENTIFILIAEEEELILNTILSRCQITRLKPITAEETKEFLQKNEVAEAKQNQIALLADGNLNVALQMANQSDIADTQLSAWLSCILKEKSQIQKFTDKMSQLSKESLKNILLHGTQLCRESLILQETDMPSRLSQNEEKVARWLGKRLSVEEIHQLSEVFEKAHYAIERNANVKLLLMSCSLKIDDIIMKRELVS